MYNHVIHKFQLWPVDGPGNVTVLKDSHIVRVLSIGWQNRKLMLWAEVDPLALRIRPHDRYFVCAVTGAEITPNLDYIGTAQLEGATISPFVMHVFEDRFGGLQKS